MSQLTEPLNNWEDGKYVSGEPCAGEDLHGEATMEETSPWSISQHRAQDPSTDPDSTAPDPPSWGLAQGAHGAHRALPNPKSTKCTSEHPNSQARFLSATRKQKPP